MICIRLAQIVSTYQKVTGMINSKNKKNGTANTESVNVMRNNICKFAVKSFVNNGYKNITMQRNSEMTKFLLFKLFTYIIDSFHLKLILNV